MGKTISELDTLFNNFIGNEDFMNKIAIMISIKDFVDEKYIAKLKKLENK